MIVTNIVMIHQGDEKLASFRTNLGELCQPE